MSAFFVPGSAQSAVTSASVTTLSVPWSSATVGDVCVLVVAVGGTSTITTPTGFTQVDTSQATGLRSSTFRHVCTGTESGSVVINWTGATGAAAAMVAYREVDTTTPVRSHTVLSGAAGTSRQTSSDFSGSTLNMNVLSIFTDVDATTANTWGTATGSGTITERVDVCSTATPFVSLSINDTFTTSASNFYTAVSSRSGTACVLFTVGLAQGVASGMVENWPVGATSGDDAATNPHTATGINPLTTNPLTAGTPVPTTGQLWPRGS